MEGKEFQVKRTAGPRVKKPESFGQIFSEEREWDSGQIRLEMQPRALLLRALTNKVGRCPESASVVRRLRGVSQQKPGLFMNLPPSQEVSRE